MNTFADARATITSAVPNVNERRAVLKLLKVSIGIANGTAPNAWAVTLLKSGFRLNTGSVEALTFSNGNWRVMLAGSAAEPQFSGLSVNDSFYENGSQPQSVFTGSTPELLSARTHIAASHERFIHDALITRSGKPWKGTRHDKSHCSALLDLAEIETRDDNPKYFVLLWDPGSEKTTRSKRGLEIDGPLIGSWSCGRSKSLRPGDRVLLRRTRHAPRGIVGIGVVVRGSYEANWITTGSLGKFVDIEWEQRSNEPLIDVEDPRTRGFIRLWGAYSGGVEIPEDQGQLIFEIVRDQKARILREGADERVLEALTNDNPDVVEKVVKRIERGPAGNFVKRHNKFKCQVCEALGRNPIGFTTRGGEPYVEAHHAIPVAGLKPGTLHRSYIMTVCANHHCQLHYGDVGNLELFDSFFQLVVDDVLVKLQRCLV